MTAAGISAIAALLIAAALYAIPRHMVRECRDGCGRCVCLDCAGCGVYRCAPCARSRLVTSMQTAAEIDDSDDD